MRAHSQTNRQCKQTDRQTDRQTDTLIAMLSIPIWDAKHCIHTTQLHEIFCTCYLWPEPAPTLTTMSYVMYFRSCGWRHVFITEPKTTLCFVRFARWRHWGRLQTCFTFHWGFEVPLSHNAPLLQKCKTVISWQSNNLNNSTCFKLFKQTFFKDGKHLAKYGNHNWTFVIFIILSFSWVFCTLIDYTRTRGSK